MHASFSLWPPVSHKRSHYYVKTVMMCLWREEREKARTKTPKGQVTATLWSFQPFHVVGEVIS